MSLSKDKKDFYIAQFQKKGKESFLAGNYEQAVRFYTKGHNLDPKDHLWLSNRCAAHLKLGDYLNAEEDAVKCIQICPSYSKGYGRLGYSLMYQGRYDEARKQFEKGINLERGGTETYCSKGRKDLDDLIHTKEERTRKDSESDRKESISAKVAPGNAPLPLASESEDQICSLCGLCGHSALNCTMKKNSAPSASSYEYCNHCNKLGHSSLYCPFKEKHDDFLRRSRDKVHSRNQRTFCNICNSLSHVRSECPNKHLFTR